MESNVQYNQTTYTGRPVKRLLHMFAPDIKDILLIYMYGLFNGLINLSLPLGIQAIIGLIIGGQVTSSWGILVMIVVVGIAASGLLHIMQLSLTETLQQRIFTRAAFEFAYRIPRFKSESISNYYPPELINRFFDIISVQKGVPKLLIDFSTSAMQIFFGLILLSFYHPFFVFFGVGLVVILLLIVLITGPTGLQTGLKESKYKYEVAHWLEELARTMDTFKLAGNTNLPLSKMDYFVQGYLGARKKHFRVLIIQFANVVGFKIFITAGLLILGSILMVRQEINLGQFVASEIVILLVINSAEKLIQSMETIYDVLVGIEKVGYITDIPLEGEEGLDFAEIDKPEGMSLSVKDLTFKYPNTKNEILSNVSFEVEPGEKVCVVGYNSAGKSTLINLISGLEDGFSGSISYNGIPLRNINITTLRTYIGDNLKQEDLFYGTLLDNITLGRPEIRLSEVMAALTWLDLGPFLQSLPQGLNTKVDPGGSKFSSATVKKILLARSIVKKPKLLVLEDFLSTLDREEHERLSDFLTRKDMPWSMVAVSNDPILAARCNRIVVMEKGRVKEIGTYEELMKKDYFRSVMSF